MDSELNFANLFVQNEAGELLYFLVAVALSFAALLIAVDQRTRSPQEVIAGRYMVALLGVVLAWGLLTLGNLVALLNADINAGQILPPLERAAITLVIIMLSWAFLTAESPSPERSTRFVVIGLLLFIGAGYLYTAATWSEETDFNQHQLGLAWTLIPLVITAVAAGLLVTRFRYAADIPLKMLFLGIVIAGHTYTLYEMLNNNLRGDVAGAIRLTMLGGLALVPVLLYRVVIDRFRMAVGEMSDHIDTISQPMMTQATPPVIITTTAPIPPPALAAQHEAMSLLKILGIMLEKTAPEDIPLQIAKAVAKTFKADVVAIAVTDNPNWADTLAAYDYIRETPIAALTINLSNQASIVTAIQRNMQTALLPGRNDQELTDLFYRLDSQGTAQSPAYIQPLPRDRKVVGLLIVAMPHSMRELFTEDRQLLQALAPIAARLLVISREALQARQQADSQAIQSMVSGTPPPTLPEMDTGKMIRAELQGQLDQAQQQITTLNEQIEALQQQISRERQTLNALIKEGSSNMTLTQKIKLLTEEREKLANERAQLLDALQAAQTIMATATADSDDAVLRQLVDNLRQERDHLHAELDHLHQELRHLQQAQGPGANLQAVASAIAADRDRMLADHARLADEVQDTQAQLAELGLEAGVTGLGQILAQLTEERNHYVQEARRAQVERDLLLKERERIQIKIDQEDARDQQIQVLQDDIARLASDREALVRQRDALKMERDSLNQQRDEWLEARVQLGEKYEEMRQKFHKANQALSESWKKRTELEDALREVSYDPALKKRLAAIEEDRSNMEFDLISARQSIEILEQELLRYQQLATAPTASPQERNLAETIMGMAQELRTPLTSIIGYTDLLLGESTGILGAVQRQFLLRVKVNTERLLQLLEDLLRVMAIDLGTLALAPQKVDMTDLIDDAITASSAQYREKGLTLHLDIADALPSITADRDAMQQVITQLLSNAYLAAPSDSIVRLSAHHEPEHRANNLSNPQDVILFSVTDQGGGIPPEEQRRVFTRMYRAENTVIQGMGDKGVGLSVTHALVTAHGGKIWFETVPGFSTTFKVVIPVEAVFTEKEKRRGSLTKLIGALEEGE